MGGVLDVVSLFGVVAFRVCVVCVSLSVCLCLCLWLVCVGVPGLQCVGGSVRLWVSGRSVVWVVLLGFGVCARFGCACRA